MLLLLFALRTSGSEMMSQLNAGLVRRSRKLWGRAREDVRSMGVEGRIINVDRADIRIARHHTTAGRVQDRRCSSSQADRKKTLRSVAPGQSRMQPKLGVGSERRLSAAS
jgi:hypothetical protein